MINSIAGASKALWIDTACPHYTKPDYKSSFISSRKQYEMFEDLYLTPFSGTVLVFVMALFGFLYRDNWKKQPENWKLRSWIYGIIAGGAILTLAFLPLKV